MSDKNMLEFQYSTDELTDSENIIKTQHQLRLIRNAEVYIDYKLALESVIVFEKLVAKNVKANITIINLEPEFVETYRTIFTFIANGGHLIFHDIMGIAKKPTPEKKKERELAKMLLWDLDYKFHGCLVSSPNFSAERDVCMLILNERKRLSDTLI